MSRLLRSGVPDRLWPSEPSVASSYEEPPDRTHEGSPLLTDEALPDLTYEEPPDPASGEPPEPSRHRRPPAWSRHARPLLLFVFVVLTGAGLAMAGVAVNRPGPGTTHVIESSSDPYDAGLVEDGAVEDSGTAFGVIEAVPESATPTDGEPPSEPPPTLAQTPMASPAGEATAQPEPADRTGRTSTGAQDRLRRVAPTATAVPAPQQATPAPRRAAPPATATPTPSDPGLLEQLFG